MKYYTIMVNGQKAVNAGRSYCAGNCYRGVFDGSRWLGQMEVVLDDDTIYHGRVSKWVGISFIRSGESIEKCLDILANLGFSQCEACISLDVDDGSFVREKGLFNTII